MAGQDDRQGTGKHGHKDTQAPWPHREGQEGRHESSKNRSSEAGRSGGEHRSGQGSGSSGSESESLKEREYRDAQGNIHHHTRTAEDQHGKDRDRK